MKKLPQDIKAEQSVIGSIISENRVFDECILSEDDFLMAQHKDIFRSIKELNSEGKAFDMITIMDKTPRTSIEYLNDCITMGMASWNFKHWQDIVLNKSKLRKYIEVFQNGLEMAFNNEDPQIEINKIETFEAKGIDEMVLIKDLMFDAVDNIEKSQDKSKGYAGFSTGLNLFDYKLDGIQSNKYHLLAARPSMGKTAFMLQLANGASEHGKNVAIYSLEMTRHELAQRMIIHQSQVHLKRVKDKVLEDKEYSLLHDAANNFMKKKIFIDDTFDQTVDSIYKSARRLNRKLKDKGEKLDLIMIDYIQLLNSSGKFESDNKKVTYDSRQIKKIAKELDTCVVALSQLNRGCESRQNKRPMMSDLRDSGSLEQDADIITFLYRDDYYREKADPDGFKPDRVAEINISKNRGGETGTIKMEWNGGKQSFYNIKN